MNDLTHPSTLASPTPTVAVRIYKHSGNCAYTVLLRCGQSISTAKGEPVMLNELHNSKEPVVRTPVLLHLLPFISYPDFQAAAGQLELTAQYHKMCRVIGHPGSGKTRLLLEFEQTHENAHYLCPSRPCRIKDLLRLLGEPLGYYIPCGTSAQVVRDLIDFLNHRACDTTFLIDECDKLCPKGRYINDIDKLDLLRYIWDHTRLHTSFIFAAPYDLEGRLQKSSEQISNSQFYRRCGIYQLQGMPRAAIQKFLSQIEQEFHVRFDVLVADELTRRIAATDRGGLGISIEIISNCLMAVRDQWPEYYRRIEAGFPREEALHLFDDAEIRTIPLPLLRKAMELMR